MQRRIGLPVLLALAAGLMACDDTAMGSAGGGSAGGSGGGSYGPVDAVPTVQEAACLAAVSARAGTTDVTAIWTQYATYGSTVTVRAGAAQWACAVTNSGRVTGLSGPGSA